MKKLLEKLQNFDIDSDQMDDFFDQLNDNDISLVNEKDSSDTDEKTESK
ncbi:RNA polymerase sigma factor RpoD [Staphylococcus aureus]|nr:RNA polymerase sigma factor RpoD [Staphylococcus aureus]